MNASTMPVVVTAALLALAHVPSASAQSTSVSVTASTTPSGAPYTPPGYSLSVPSDPQVVTAGAVVQPRARPPETQSVRELWIPGLVGLPISYVMTWVVASVTQPVGSGGVDVAYIPVVGPWLILGQGLEGGDEGFYITMGAIQAVSLVCLVLGLAIRLPKPRADGPSLSLRPTRGGAMSAILDF